MKVLLLSPLPPPTSGIGSWTLNLLRYYSDKSYPFEIIHQNTALKYRNSMKDDLWNRGFLGIKETIRTIYELRKNIKKYSPDLIHLTSSASLALFKDFIILKIAKKKKISLIVHWHFGRIPTLAILGNWEWKLLINIIRKSHTSIVIDKKSYETLIMAGFDNVVNIPNPVRLIPGQNVNTLSENPGLRKQGSLIFAGHIIRNKGVFELVEACSQLTVIKELSLIGPYLQFVKDELLNLAFKKDNGRWLKFHGNLAGNQVLEQMLKSPILVLPSYTEGFPNVVIEAMSVGCAVIATDVGAIPEILAISTDEPCGICVPVRNIEKLRDAILALLEDPEKAQMMGKNGSERVLKNYTLNKVMKQYISVWSKAFAG